MSGIPKALVSTGKDDWATPQYIVDWACDHLGIIAFNLDAAASASTSKGVLYFGPDHHYESKRDTFAFGWGWPKSWTEPMHVWCNPPYSRAGGGLAKWCARMQRAAEHEDCVVVGFFFAKTETVAWHESVAKASEVFFLRGRVSFIDPATGKSPGPAPAPSVLVIWRPCYTGPPTYKNLDLRHLR